MRGAERSVTGTAKHSNLPWRCYRRAESSSRRHTISNAAKTLVTAGRLVRAVPWVCMPCLLCACGERRNPRGPTSRVPASATRPRDSGVGSLIDDTAHLRLTHLDSGSLTAPKSTSSLPDTRPTRRAYPLPACLLNSPSASPLPTKLLPSYKALSAPRLHHHGRLVLLNKLGPRRAD